MEKIFDLLNTLSELIYISDIETYELLYMNEPGQKMFGVTDYKGLKCYTVLQGKEEPCSFCTNSILKSDSCYTWEFTNEIAGRHYLLKDKRINWEGKHARIEIAFDTTESQQQKEALKSLLDMEMVIVNCVKELHKTKNIDDIINEILRIVGTYLDADRVYIFNINGSSMNNTYEWCRENIAPE